MSDPACLATVLDLVGLRVAAVCEHDQLHGPNDAVDRVSAHHRRIRAFERAVRLISETAFGFAFAAGALIFGFIADRTNVRWLYPVVLFLWSLMGFLTGFVQTFTGLLLCRLFLGLFESGHWPCALKTTHRLLPPESRALGNSILQSGTAIGAIITPLIMVGDADRSTGKLATGISDHRRQSAWSGSLPGCSRRIPPRPGSRSSNSSAIRRFRRDRSR